MSPGTRRCGFCLRADILIALSVKPNASMYTVMRTVGASARDAKTHLDGLLEQNLVVRRNGKYNPTPEGFTGIDTIRAYNRLMGRQAGVLSEKWD